MKAAVDFNSLVELYLVHGRTEAPIAQAEKCLEGYVTSYFRARAIASSSDFQTTIFPVTA